MDGIIFDIDGTLWDSSVSVLESWNEVIAAQAGDDKQITAEFLSTLFGLPMTEIARRLFPDLPAEEQQRLGELCFEYEDEYLETHPGTIYDGVLDTMKKLSKKLNLYVVSNCQCGYLDVFLRVTGIQEFITDSLCFGDTGTPKSETIRTLMNKNQMNSAVYVGDTQMDADACSDAGIPFIFADYGFGDVPNAKWTIHSFCELLDINYEVIK